MIRGLALVVALGGCAQVWGLDRESCMVVGHDEDGDCIADDLDPCPADVDANDADGDGIGDACDPNPAQPGDRLLEFVSFAEIDVGQRWISNDGRWVLGDDGDSVRYDLAAFDPVQYSVLTDGHGTRPLPYTAIAHVMIEHFPAGHAHFGMIGATAGGNTGIACSVIRPSAGEDFAQLYQSEANKREDLIQAVADGSRYEIRYTYDPAVRMFCDVRNAQGGGARPTLMQLTAPPTGPFSFEANGSTVRVENVAFYAR